MEKEKAFDDLRRKEERTSKRFYVALLTVAVSFGCAASGILACQGKAEDALLLMSILAIGEYFVIAVEIL